MSVLGNIYQKLSEGPVQIALIDPDKQTPKEASSMSEGAERGGSGMILVGGTTGVDERKQRDTLYAVRKGCALPIVIFPTSADVLSHDADAIFYMSLVNSRNVRYVFGEAMRSSLTLAAMDIEVISVGYLVFEPGMLVGKVGEVDLIKRDDIDSGMSYAKAIELMGFDICYLEGGSGVAEPIPSSMISAIRETVDIPLIVGGGINSPRRAAEVVRAGADIVVTGTILEETDNVSNSISKMVSAMNEAWKEREP